MSSIVEQGGEYTQMAYQKETEKHVWRHNLANHISHGARIQKMYIFHSRTVVQYILEHAYMTCSCGVMHVSMHKVAYQKETTMCF